MAFSNEFIKKSNLFNTFEEYQIIPEIDIGNRCGSTYYNDFIGCNDFPENCNIIRFKDKYNRYSLSFRFRLKNASELKSDIPMYVPKKVDETDIYGITIFQRYINGGNWVSCRGAGRQFMDFDIYNYQKYLNPENFKKLLNGECITVDIFDNIYLMELLYSDVIAKRNVAELYSVVDSLRNEF